MGDIKDLNRQEAIAKLEEPAESINISICSLQDWQNTCCNKTDAPAGGR